MFLCELGDLSEGRQKQSPAEAQRAQRKGNSMTMKSMKGQEDRQGNSKVPVFPFEAFT